VLSGRGEIEDAPTTETTGNNKLRLHQEEEGVQGYHSNQDECYSREDKATIVESEKDIQERNKAIHVILLLTLCRETKCQFQRMI